MTEAENRKPLTSNFVRNYRLLKADRSKCWIPGTSEQEGKEFCSTDLPLKQKAN